ncbi:MAG: cytochrome d ubiquinol oxidase subunit II [Muribaculaceae bacterium]|nr:cytochrome d ubiquinol oxidase subunit II [Muribaculaceae bacterium]
MTLEYLQNYWWVIVSVLGGILVFLLFVQGGQTMLLGAANEKEKLLIVNSIGRKWELTFTTLVLFGGALFASFPLFYSTSFGGAYWLWICILFSFILQAVSYEYRDKPGNVFGRKTYDTFLFINGSVGCLLLGVAVAMFFFGAEFSVDRQLLTDVRQPVISHWAHTHGFEAIFNWQNLLLGVAVLFLARTLACMYMINNIDNDELVAKLRAKCLTNAGIFLVFFLWFMAMLWTATGQVVVDASTTQLVVEEEDFKYFHNMTRGWWIGMTFLIGVILVLFSIYRACFVKGSRNAVWFGGIGTALTVISLFWAAGFMDTPFYPSIIDPSSSLSIRNASSSEFTLVAMTYVSIGVPFVLAYIAYVWRKMDSKKLTISELEETSHKY